MVVQCVIEVSSEHYYSCELTKKIPVRVSIVTINGDTGFGILEPLEGGERSLKQYVEELRNSQSTTEVEVTYSSPKSYWTRVIHKMDGPSINETIRQGDCMSFLPILVERGIQKHTVLAPSREILSKLLHTLRDRFTSVHIKRIRSVPDGPSQEILTEKQNRAFSLAFESGYYEIPRKCTVEKLATKIGIRRVAMQERLRRAELRIFSHYLENQN